MPVTLSGFTSGLLVFTIFMAAVAAIWAWIYNFMVPAPRTTFAESSAAKAGAKSRAKETVVYTFLLVGLLSEV